MCILLLCDKLQRTGLAGGVSCFLGSEDVRRNINTFHGQDIKNDHLLGVITGS